MGWEGGFCLSDFMQGVVATWYPTTVALIRYGVASGTLETMEKFRLQFEPVSTVDSLGVAS